MQIARNYLSPTIRRVSLLARIMPLPVALSPPRSRVPLSCGGVTERACPMGTNYSFASSKKRIGTCCFHASRGKVRRMAHSSGRKYIVFLSFSFFSAPLSTISRRYSAIAAGLKVELISKMNYQNRYFNCLLSIIFGYLISRFDDDRISKIFRVNNFADNLRHCKLCANCTIFHISIFSFGQTIDRV